jgi:hypothetical protein
MRHVGRWPRPFAVGILAMTGPDVAEHRPAERLRVAMDAYRYGYFLIDTIETGADGAGYVTAAVLAERTGADAFVTRGPVDDLRLAGIAGRQRLVVRASWPAG